MPNVFFCVLTWGASGSAWVAKLLNAHPDLWCCHAIGQKARWQVDFGGAYSGETGLGPENALAYCRWILVHAEGCVSAGDVHGIDLPTWRRIEPQLTPFSGEPLATRSAVLVRHPIPRIESYIAQHRRYLEVKLRQADFFKPYVEARELAGRLGLDWAPEDYEKLMFLEACRLAARRIVEERRSGYRVFRLEDLVQGVQGPQDLLSHLSAGALTSWPPGVLEHLQGQTVNRHRSTDVSDPLEIFSGWPDWRRELFQRMFDPDSVAAYQALQYDLPCGAVRGA